MEDFSKTKAPTQLAVGTFYTSIEPWLRPPKEEDVGFLEYMPDEVEPFVMPKLGRHYSEVWEEEDIALYGGPLPSTTAIRGGGHLPGSSSSGPLPKWEPSTLQEADLLSEERGHGPLTERLVSALIPMQNATEWKGVKAAEEAMEGRPGTNGAAAAAARDKLNVADLEERIKNVMRFYGFLDEIVSRLLTLTGFSVILINLIIRLSHRSPISQRPSMTRSPRLCAMLSSSCAR